MLEIKGLDSFYGDSHILHNVCLSVPAGGRVAIMGRNGAGKSTLLKSIMNAGPTTRGEIGWSGQSLNRMPTHRRARMGLCLVPEDRRILSDLTVLENLRMASRAAAGAAERPSPSEVLQRFPMLVPLENRLGGRLSGGQQQMLALARAVLANPRLLLLDEPTEGLAPVIVEQLVDHVLSIVREAGGSLLLCEQNVWFARKCTSHVYVIDSGRVVFGGSWDEFDAHDEIKARHLAV